jgi:hypothetical protein
MHKNKTELQDVVSIHFFVDLTTREIPSRVNKTMRIEEKSKSSG